MLTLATLPAVSLRVAHFVAPSHEGLFEEERADGEGPVDPLETDAAVAGGWTTEESG